MDVIEICGPVVESAEEIFQVTMPNGVILTRTYDFGDATDLVQRAPLFAENGTMLVAPR